MPDIFPQFYFDFQRLNLFLLFAWSKSKAKNQETKYAISTLWEKLRNSIKSSAFVPQANASAFLEFLSFSHSRLRRPAFRFGPAHRFFPMVVLNSGHKSESWIVQNTTLNHTLALTLTLTPTLTLALTLVSISVRARAPLFPTIDTDINYCLN